VLAVFLLTLGFMAVGLIARSLIHKRHQDQVAEIKREEQELDERRDAVLARHRRLTKEMEALEDRVVLLEGGLTEVEQQQKAQQAGEVSGPESDPAARWLLSTGKLSIEDYSKVMKLLRKSDEKLGFVEACLALGVISQSVAELAASRSG
jgi:hypothetical protein